jgi:hypothetical protein
LTSCNLPGNVVPGCFTLIAGNNKIKLAEEYAMRPEIVGLTRRGSIVNQEAVVQCLKEGKRPKFMITVCADLKADQLVLVILIGTDIPIHEEIMGRWSVLGKDLGLNEVSLKPSGGRIKITGDTLAFFDQSNKYGRFEQALIEKANQEELLGVFGVKEVRFENY